MSKFPEPLPLSREIIKKRLLRRKEMVQTARRGVILRGIIVLAEIVGFALWGSSVLLLDAIASSIDLLSSYVLIWSIRKADTPPDADHPFGHGRFEPVAGLFIAILLIVLGFFSGYEQILALLQHQNKVSDINGYVWLIPGLGVVLLEISYQKVKRTAKNAKSPALMADAIHYRIDAVSSLLALISLGLAALFPIHTPFFDHFGAITIAILMIGLGIVATRKNISQLLDQTPSKEYFDLVRKSAVSVEGVLATEKLRLQVYGPDAYVAIDIEVDPQLSVAVAHRLTQKVRRAIQLAWPAVRDVIVHVEPYYPSDHEP